MALIYQSETDSKMTGHFDPMKVNGLRQYEKHFSNLMYLDFFVRNPKSTFAEKRQAEKEMEIARRKINYWKRIVEAQGETSKIPEVTNNVKKQWV